jgi:hypothetical protein
MSEHSGINMLGYWQTPELAEDIEQGAIQHKTKDLFADCQRGSTRASANFRVVHQFGAAG